MLSKLKVTDGIPNEDFLVCGRGCMSNVQKERNANVRDQIFLQIGVQLYDIHTGNLFLKIRFCHVHCPNRTLTS